MMLPTVLAPWLVSASYLKFLHYRNCHNPCPLQTLGVDLVVMTPSRGYSAELAATAIIALASTYGLPVSTTQVIVGSAAVAASI
eukprot:scaffold153529_cov24-Tisochrysis_lutea.AAC.1